MRFIKSSSSPPIKIISKIFGYNKEHNCRNIYKGPATNNLKKETSTDIIGI